MYKNHINLLKYSFERPHISILRFAKQQSSTNSSDKNVAEKKDNTVQWTKPWTELEGTWQSKFNLFAPKKGISLQIFKFLTSSKNFTPTGIKNWYQNVKRNVEIQDQIFSKERHNFLGNDLAAAHFIVFRGGSVRFAGQKRWFKLDEYGECEDLPKFFAPDLYLSHIDCSNMKIYYEGLQNLYRLNKLTSLSFHNCATIDDFCLDRVSGEFGDSLKYLDISGCSITEHGLGALYRLSNLETLVVSDIKRSTAFELTCAMLELLYPQLVIKSIELVNKK